MPGSAHATAATTAIAWISSWPCVIAVAPPAAPASVRAQCPLRVAAPARGRPLERASAAVASASAMHARSSAAGWACSTPPCACSSAAGRRARRAQAGAPPVAPRRSARRAARAGREEEARRARSRSRRGRSSARSAAARPADDATAPVTPASGAEHRRERHHRPEPVVHCRAAAAGATSIALISTTPTVCRPITIATTSSAVSSDLERAHRAARGWRRTPGRRRAA